LADQAEVPGTFEQSSVSVAPKSLDHPPAKPETEVEVSEIDPPSFEELVTGEELLSDAAETIWRQCAPGHFDKRTGKPSDEMFRATDADHGKMSGARSSKATAEQAYRHRTEVLKKPSAGSWGVSVAEIKKVNSRAVDDSILQPPPPPEPPPGHTYIDVRHLDHLDKEGRRKLRSTLLIFANKRNRQFPIL
jgi:hypothetical protein